MITFLVWGFVIFVLLAWVGVVLIGPPYVPTLKRDIEQLFSDIKLGKNDFLVDLGAGDGRILLSATDYGARVEGVEINPFLVMLAKWRLKQQKGVVKVGNIWRYSLPTEVTHVFVFPAEVYMNKLEQYLEMEKKRLGKRFWVICYGFQFRERKLEKKVGAFNLYKF